MPQYTKTSSNTMHYKIVRDFDSSQHPVGLSDDAGTIITIDESKWGRIAVTKAQLFHIYFFHFQATHFETVSFSSLLISDHINSGTNKNSEFCDNRRTFPG